MAEKEDGEFELILGNRQLISVFLIVVILLGVFFSMGYIVGRNAAAATNAEASRLPAPNPIIVDKVAKVNAPPAEESGPAHPAASPNPAQTPSPEAVRDLSKPSPLRPLDSKPLDVKRDEPKRVEPAMVPTTAGEPVPGQYLQVVATTRGDAEIVAESLVKKGFRSMVTAVPGSNLNRVLVGPMRDASDLADTRTRLEAAGFKPYVRRY